MFWPPSQYTLGEAYIYDDIDIEGDIHAFFRFINYLREMRPGLVQRLRWLRCLFALPGGGRPRGGRQAAELSGSVHSQDRDRQAISYHYDTSNEFFQLWLDSRMTYSCAYFADRDEDLDTAQKRKLDHICRKLRLVSGERLLDIGCGWGGLVIHAARQYGVHALGITLSQRQVDFARARIREAGLEDRCRVEFQDYREVSGRFDKLVSVGMFEHVGGKMLPVYFRQANALLAPRRRLSQPRHRAERLGEETARPGVLAALRFSRRRVEAHSLHLEGSRESGTRSARRGEPARALCADRHALGAPLEACADEAKRLTNETTYRIWRLYMAGSADGFWSARGNIYQTLLVKPDRGVSGLPLTRADWYQ